MIRLENIWFHYGIRPILKNVNLDIPEGELVAVMGPNGMGKSTLLALIAGMIFPIKGRVIIDGRVRRSSIEDEKAIRRKVVYLPAESYLPLYRTGREFLLTVGRIYDVEDERLMNHCQTLLELFDLKDNADSNMSSYSTGQRKKIAICSALITEAPVMILDEPFSGGLDSSALLALSHILKSLADRKDVTIVMAVPVPELVEPIAHKIAIVSHGEIVAYDTPQGLRETTQCQGSLNEVLENFLHPDVVENIEAYLESRKA